MIVPTDAAVLQCAVQRALACPDDVWYRYMVTHDLCGCKLSDTEEQSVVEGAAETAAKLVQHIKTKYGVLSPEKLLQVLGIKLARTVEELREPYLYMGIYEPSSRTITLNESAIGQVRKFIKDNHLECFTPEDTIENIALFHEIFHALEEETPEIYTRSRMLDRRVLGIFPYRRGLGSASEVGAVHFSKCMAAISYSPCIYERYLLLSLQLLSIDFFAPSV